MSKNSNELVDHDSFFKGSMKYIEIAQDFFEAHLEQELLQRINLKSLRIEQGSFIDEAHKKLSTDILYSAEIDDQLGYIYLLVEAQSRPEKLMPFRLLSYMCRILQMHQEQQEKALDKLPVVLPIVIYNGKATRYPYSTKILDCFNHPALMEAFFLNGFRLLDLTVTPDEELARHKRAALMELLEKHIRIKDILPLLDFLRENKLLLEVNHIDNGAYFRFYVRYIINRNDSCDPGQVINKLTQQLPEQEDNIMTIADRLVERGMQQGMQQAYQEKLEMARDLFRAHVEIDVIQKVTGLKKEDFITCN